MSDQPSAPLDVLAPASDSFRLVGVGLRRLAIALWVVAAASIPIGLATHGVGSLLAMLIPVAFTGWFGWMVLWRPHIRVTPSTLVIVDVRRTTTIEWQRVEAIRGKYGLEVRTSEGERRVWIAPRPTARLRLDREPLGVVTSEPVSVETSAARLRAFAPPRDDADGPPPPTVMPATITHRTHGWSMALLVALGVVGFVVAAQL